MHVAKIVVEAPVASFRYPHFLIGQQLTYDLPPPSTIYGHVAAALGELPPPESFRFAYNFQSAGRASDLEHQHILTPGGGRASFLADGAKHPVSVDVTIQPHKRDFLFRPRLTLYLDKTRLATAFKAPVFCLTLGRSQDLATVVSCETIELEQRESAYFDSTILPFSLRQSIGRGVTVQMPRFIEPPPERRAHFGRFIVIRDPVFAGPLENPSAVSTASRMLLSGGAPRWWVDPASPSIHGCQRGVYFLEFAA